MKNLIDRVMEVFALVLVSIIVVGTIATEIVRIYLNLR